MKISIFCGCYYPQVHPRAFRAEELAKEFVRRGHDVTIVNMHTIEDFDYDSYSHKNNIKVVNLDILHGRTSQVANSAHRFLFVNRIKRFCIDYLISGYLFKYVKETVPKLGCLEGCDAVITLSTPFECFYSISRYITKVGKHFVVIGDSGDPFYYSKQTKRAIWFKFIEKKVYSHFDYLTIPTSNAISLYSPLIDESKIKIIPQGFNMRNIRLFEGKLQDEPINIAYAGVFYWDIRNPSFLFRYLDKCGFNFRLHLYMRQPDARYLQEIEQYPNVKENTILKYSLPHNDLLYELSKMHFLINIENKSNTQMPSKLIDYAMTGRPIFSCNESSFVESECDAFMIGNYDGKYKINVDDYNIEYLAEKFENLILSKKQEYE